MTFLVPEVLGLASIFGTGNLGIANAMLSGTGITPPSVNMPGLPNFEKTLVKTFEQSFAPVVSVISAAGGILIAAQEILISPPTEWIDLIANNIATPVSTALSVISQLLPPTADSIGNIILAPILEHLKLPTDDYYFPASNFQILPDLFPDIQIPIPAFGSNLKPTFPTLDGDTIPPSIKVLLGLISFPINFIFQVFQPIKEIFDAITNPANIASAVDSLLNFVTNVLPTLENILEKILAAIGIPEPSLGIMLPTFNSLISKFVDGILLIIKYALGVEEYNP